MLKKIYIGSVKDQVKAHTRASEAVAAEPECI